MKAREFGRNRWFAATLAIRDSPNNADNQSVESSALSAIANDIDDLICRNQSWLRRVVAARTGSKDAVDEVLAEVALAITKSVQIPEAEAERAPWLCKIAVRQSALYLRKLSRQRKLAEGYAEQTAGEPQQQDDPIYWLMDQEKHDLVRQCLGEMPAAARALLLMKFVERLTYDQIGSRLEVASHVAEYRVAKAKKHLRTMLTQRGINSEDLS